MIEQAQQLRALGVGIRIDDFGTGYATLAQLRRLPVSALKIDRSFVSTMLSSCADHAIVAATIGLGTGLGLDLVAEGVENEQHRDALAELGCKLAQGWLWAPALAAHDFTQWWTNQIV